MFIIIFYQKEKYEKDKVSINAYKQLLELTELKRNYLWLKEVDSIALQTCILNLDKAFGNFYHGKGYPKFRAKGNHDSYQTEIRTSEYKGIIHENIRIDFNASINIMFEGIKIYMKSLAI